MVHTHTHKKTNNKQDKVTSRRGARFITKKANFVPAEARGSSYLAKKLRL